MLDARPYELNTPTGIVDLKTGELADHDRNAFHTRMTGVGYDENGDTPKWDSFLHTTFQGDRELIAFMQRLAGYACIGEVTHHILPFLYGEVGQNGKSVLLNVFQQCLGTYAVTLPVAALVTGRNSHTEDTADLPGARLAVCSEIGQNTKWDEEKIKSMTGGDTLTARANYGHKFQYVPTHTIMIAANDRPRVEAGGKSFFRRVKLIPFLHSVSDENVNERLTQELIEQEGAAILAWMVRGAVDVVANGLRPPGSVDAATGEYAEAEDEVGQWIADCCQKVDGGESGEPGAKLYHSYQTWCRANGADARSNTAFGIALNKHGHPSKRTSSARVRLGLMLLKPDALDDSEGRAQQRFWETGGQ
jgi:putative DNA primase/helicase